MRTRMRTITRGYSLYELLVTLAVAAIVIGAGVPSMQGLMARTRQHVELNALFHAVHLARKESITKRRVVSLCPSTDGRQCSASLDWSPGWILFVNDDRDSPPRVDPGEAILDRHKVSQRLRISANRRGFTNRGTWYRATNGTLVVCDLHDRISARALVVSYTGRPRVAARRTNGDPYACAH